MAKINRYSGNVEAFASNAGVNQRTVFGSTSQSDTLDSNINSDFLSGWEKVLSGNLPPKEWFNAVGYTSTLLSAYLHQVGIAEYDSGQEYHANSLCNTSGVIYRSLIDSNTGNNPLTDDGSIWIPQCETNKNEIVNSDFDVWQISTSQTSSGYGSDDFWNNENSGSTKTHTRQSFTIGQTDVPENPKYYSNTVVSTGGGASDYTFKQQRIESVDTLSGGSITLSFWARADTTRNIATELSQVFGTGGSPSPAVTGIGVTTHTLTTSWSKFITTVTLPSVLGKTVGTNSDDYLGITFWFDAGSDYNSRTNSIGTQSGTFDIAKVKVESGSIATKHVRPDILDEYKKCYKRLVVIGDTTSTVIGSGVIVGSTNPVISVSLPSKMRALPTATLLSGTLSVNNGGAGISVTGFSVSGSDGNFLHGSATGGSGFTTGNGAILLLSAGGKFSFASQI